MSLRERNSIFKSYYACDNSSKNAFIIRTSERNTKSANSSDSRSFSYKYFCILGNEKIRVCKTFYLATLVISKERVYSAHKNKDLISGIVPASKSGKHVKKEVSACDKDFVREHIKSFPKINSDYRRKQTSKEYLEFYLNINKMYELYEEKCFEQNRSPVKGSMYRNVFNNEFNLSFHKPKNDRCDTCEFFKISNPNDIEYLNHLQLKTSIRNDRNIDRENSDEITICFDLQRVITCPKSFISNFYYKRKINVYNLTAHESINKTGLCCVWDESLSGRSGNDIASGLIKILEKIVEMYPNIVI